LREYLLGAAIAREVSPATDSLVIATTVTLTGLGASQTSVEPIRMQKRTGKFRLLLLVSALAIAASLLGVAATQKLAPPLGSKLAAGFTPPGDGGKGASPGPMKSQ
jgi:hypothetical protein